MQLTGMTEAAAPAQQELALHVVLVGNDRIEELNREFLGHSGPTDVIAFGLGPGVRVPDEPCVVGEIYVSLEVAVSAAAAYSKDVGYEVLLYVAHGILHLAGEDDQTPAGRRRMRRIEQQVMSGLQARYHLKRIFGF